MERLGLACVGRGLASYPLALRGTQHEIQPSFSYLGQPRSIRSESLLRNDSGRPDT